MKRACPQRGAEQRHLVGDPIDVVSGALVDRMRDFVLDGPFPVEWWRYYDSRWHDEDRGLGFGQRHPFDHWLVFDVDGIAYRRVDGYEIPFAFVTEIGRSARSGGYTLERVDADGYRLLRHAEPTLEFRRRKGEREAKLVALHRGADAVLLHYDANDRLSRVLAANDATLEIEWQDEHIMQVVHRSAGGNRKTFIRYRYENGFLVEGHDAYDHSFAFRYDAHGRLAQRTDRRGYNFHWEYDDEGRCIRSHGDGGLFSVELRYIPLAYRTEVLDANGGEWVYEYLPNGLVTFITDPYGGTRYYQIDDDGRLVAEYDEKGAKTEYCFDAAGAPIEKITPDGDVISLPADEDLVREHRVPSTPLQWELGDLPPLDFELPDRQEVPFELPPQIRATLVTSEDPQRGKLVEVRDEQGLLLREESEEGRCTFAYNPNGNPRRWTDFDGGVHRLEHGLWNQIVKEIDPAGSETSYEYTHTNKLAAVVDPAGVRTDYGYDLRDRLIEVRRGGLIREHYVYDAGDSLVEKRDSRGEVILSIVRDRMGRALERRLASGEHYAYSYDARGQLTRAESSDHTYEFAHDSAGRRMADKRDGSGVVHRFGGLYLFSTTVLDRFRTDYRHRRGMTEILDPTRAVHRIRHHGHGIFTRELSNGLRETVQFHPRTQQVLRKSVWSADGPAWTRSYHYSAEGDLLAVEDGERGTTRYTHDAAHRLQRVEHPDGRIDAYEYNRAGSLFRSPTLDGTVDEFNGLRYANGERLEYDDRHHVRGRVGASGSMHYDRDSRDQLVVVYWDGADGRTWGWDAAYDPLGRRIRKSPHYHKHSYYYWDGDRLAAEVMRENRLRVYVYADAFAMVPLLFVDYESVDADPASGVRYFVFTDQRGCPERLVDDTGQAVWSARIDPYGYARVEVGPKFHQPLRFPGHYADRETGLHYNRFRYYSPELGQYLESDPLGLAGGLNLYAYTTNPLTHVDVRGLSDCDGVSRPSRPDADSESPAVQRIVRRLRRLVGVFTPPIETGLGRDVDRLVNQSRTLREQIHRLQSNGWIIARSFTDTDASWALRPNRVVVIGSRLDTNQTLVALAHEVGHAHGWVDPHIHPSNLTREQYVERNLNRHLQDEARAQWNHQQVRSEIRENTGHDIGNVGLRNEDVYADTHRQVRSGEMTREEGLQRMANAMREEQAWQGTYGEDFGESTYGPRWDSHVAENGVHPGGAAR